MKMQIKSSEVLILLAASAMSFLANLPDSILSNMVDRKALLIALTALIVVAMLHYLRMVLLLAISILAIGANLPAELASSLGISQLALLVSLSVMVTIFLLNRAATLLPKDEEIPSPTIANSRQNLLTAITKGDVPMLHRLISMKVDVNFTEDGMTPLHLAAEQGNIEIVRLLIAQGADYRKKTSEGKSLAEIMKEKIKLTQAEELQHNANKTLFAHAQAEPRRGDNASWRDQHA